MATNIPIKLVASPSGKTNIDQLMVYFVKYIGASISANVNWFITGTVDPNSSQGLFFNTAQNVFKSWSNGLGKYVPIGAHVVGTVIDTFVGGDEPSLGYVLLDGRSINAITGISTAQKTALESLFSVGGAVPNIPVFRGFNTAPADGAFSGIDFPDVAPANGVIGGCVDVATLAPATETLRDSTDTLNTQTKTVRNTAETLLVAVNSAAGLNATNPIYKKVFVGYP